MVQSKPIERPSKPYPEFPLSPAHDNRWYKKIRGVKHYFGKWNDPDGALADYLKKKDRLHSGLSPKDDHSEMTVHELVNQFRTHLDQRVTDGELSPLSLRDYVRACDLVIDHFGKKRLAADSDCKDFTAIRKTINSRYGLNCQTKFVSLVRSIFKFGFDEEFLSKSIKFGKNFRRPSKRLLTIFKEEKSNMGLSRSTIVSIMNIAGPKVRTMVLLGINCGYGNTDCGSLKIRHVNLKTGWLSMRRSKTGCRRLCKLWPETVEALRTVINAKPEALRAVPEELVFRTKSGKGFNDCGSGNEIGKQFTKLLKKIEPNFPKGKGFYSLRRTFETMAENLPRSVDLPAIKAIMGHTQNDQTIGYRQKLFRRRLRKISRILRRWLFRERLNQGNNPSPSPARTGFVELTSPPTDSTPTKLPIPE